MNSPEYKEGYNAGKVGGPCLLPDNWSFLQKCDFIKGHSLGRFALLNDIENPLKDAIDNLDFPLIRELTSKTVADIARLINYDSTYLSKSHMRNASDFKKKAIRGRLRKLFNIKDE